MKSLLFVTAVTGLTAFSVPAIAGEMAIPPAELEVPAETLKAFESFLKREDLEGEYVLYAKSVVSKKNGKGKNTEETVMKIVSRGDDTQTELISHTKNGVDETEKRRKEMEKSKKEAEENGGETKKKSRRMSFDLGMDLPTQSHRDKYDFSPGSGAAALQVARFKPKPKAKDPDKLVTGKLAWDPKSLDPVWIEQTPAKLPRYVEKLWVRTEFQRVGDKITLKSVHTKGVGGILLIKRKFDVLIEIRDYKP